MIPSRNWTSQWPGFVWILASLFLCLYAALTVFMWPSETGFVWNLNAIENGRLAWMVSLVLLCIPAWRVFRRGALWLILPFSASALLSWPLIRAGQTIHQLSNGKHGFSFYTWISGTSASYPTEKLQLPGDSLYCLRIQARPGFAKPIDVILLHGGGFYQGSPEWMHSWASALAVEGYNVWMPSYPLHSGAAFPQSSTLLLEHLKRWDAHWYPSGSAHRMRIIGGSSAGGTLALNTARLAEATQFPIQAIVALYPITDFRVPFASISNVRRIYQQYIPDSSLAAEASPVLHPPQQPTLLLHGEKDRIVPISQSVQLAQRAPQSIRFIALSWATHNFEYPICGPSGQTLMVACEAFIEAQWAQFQDK